MLHCNNNNNENNDNSNINNNTIIYVAYNSMETKLREAHQYKRVDRYQRQ